ncbi:uncharacterized protein LTR77_009177 [Saxophila tyrrhenica]|uniref:S1-like domain-containing protein n=1 Tax=Saxophila tyrrhenica TaxID=1690608 RepID=A0AAV9P171_9PEZI|nr:hypothetical protein LTR77_009177 [Saxophila tyrrhenica]
MTPFTLSPEHIYALRWERHQEDTLDIIALQPLQHLQPLSETLQVHWTPLAAGSKRELHAIADETSTPPAALPSSHIIGQVKQAAGKNLYQLELADGQTILAELGSRFRSTVWMKRGSFVVVDTSALADRENKLGGEIVNVVRDERAWRKMSWWPKEFATKKSAYEDDSDDEGPTMPPLDSEEEAN